MGNGNKRVPPEVETAIDLAKQAGWDVSIRNAKIVITAPDAVNITIGMNPNDESMKVFRSSARKYNLVGEGPARTPAESEALMKQLEEETERKAKEANKQRKVFEAAQQRKQTEAEAAREKADAATQAGLVEVEPEPVVEETRVVPNGFPVFDPALLGQIQSDLFLINLPNGEEYYCIECWSSNLKFTSKRPQGLAMHRGIRHGLYGGKPALTAPAVSQETSAVTTALPADVQAAVELLVSVIGENVTGGNSEEVETLTKQVADLEKKLEELKTQSERDLSLSDKQYTDAKAAFDKANEASKNKIHELMEELSGKDGIHATETEQLMKSFRTLLSQVQDALNTQAPLKAVGTIDELIRPFMA